MPWCDPCSRFVPAPPGAEAEASCPTCGSVAASDAGEPPRAPWHFKLLVVSAAGYLLWRALQGLGWLAGRL